MKLKKRLYGYGRSIAPTLSYGAAAMGRLARLGVSREGTLTRHELQTITNAPYLPRLSRRSPPGVTSQY